MGKMPDENPLDILSILYQLLSVMRPHPSFEEAMTEALERLAEKL